MTGQTPHRHARRRTGVRIVLGTLTSTVIVALFAALLVARPADGLADGTGRDGLADAHDVSQLQSDSYCPARMSLADTGTYGDSEFQASAGDIASSARYAAFGSVFRSTVGTLSEADGTALAADSGGDVASVMTASGSVDDGSTLLSTRLLDSQDGTGAIGAQAAWATTGDLRGVSAATCVAPALEHVFVIGATTTGTTQQLVIANPSSKATSLSVEAWGADGRVTLSTGETVTVPGQGETVVDISAAAPDQQGLAVRVTSRQTPVAAVVRTVKADGLTSKGSDFALPSSEPAATSIMPSVRAGDRVQVVAYGDAATDTTLAWVMADGLEPIGRHRIEAGAVAIIDVGEAPEGALALASTAQDPIRLSAELTRSGDGQQADFALVGAQTASATSAVTIPDHMDGTLTVVNAGTAQADGTLTGYDADGRRTGRHTVTLGANAAVSLEPDVAGEGAVTFTLESGDGSLVWGVRLASAQVDDADLAGLAALPPTALAATTERIWSSQNPAIVR